MLEMICFRMKEEKEEEEEVLLEKESELPKAEGMIKM